MKAYRSKFRVVQNFEAQLGLPVLTTTPLTAPPHGPAIKLMWVQERYSPQSVLRRLQRHAPSWLEQLPQLPDVVFDNLQHSRELEQRATEQQARAERLRQHAEVKTRQHRRRLLAAVACIGAAVTALPGGWEVVGNAPLISWIFAGVGLVLLWPRDN